LRLVLSFGLYELADDTMLVNQGRIAIKYWMDVDVEPSIMHSELARVLNIQQ
jgi:hypothetical protein